MSWIAAASLGGSVIGGLLSSNAQKDAATSASNAQERSAQLAIDEQRRQFDEVQKLLSPYVKSGNSALTQQLSLLGLNGNDAQQSVYSMLENSPGFQGIVKQGENAILQNASATGGLRGGNTQGALAQFRPQMLQSLIQQQFQNLGGIVNTGQASAAGVGSAGQNSANAISALLGQQGASQAGSALARGNADANFYGNLTGGINNFFGRTGGLF